MRASSSSKPSRRHSADEEEEEEMRVPKGIQAFVLFAVLFCIVSLYQFNISIVHISSRTKLSQLSMSFVEEEVDSHQKGNQQKQQPPKENQNGAKDEEEEEEEDEDDDSIAPSATANDTATSQPLQPCPPIPRNLVGRLKVVQKPVDWKRLKKVHSEVLRGGRNRPRDCKAKDKVAIIIPYRDRETQLQVFLNHIHPILSRQDIDYGIYVVNQVGTTKFNRAMLFNVGFSESLKEYGWGCFVFHDVDLLPEDDRNIYSCPENPRHMSVAVDKFKYKLPYAAIFGGVTALKREHFEAVNGFSNQYWGWGAEDDDMYNRIKHAKLNISRYSPEIARYTMLKHKKEEANKNRMKQLRKGKRLFGLDGLNNLNYEVKSIQYKPLYTMINVDIRPVKAGKRKKWGF